MKPSTIRNSVAAVGATAAGLALGWWGAGSFVRHGAAPRGPMSVSTKPAPLAGHNTDPLAAGIAGIWAAGDPSAQTAAAVAWARALAPADFSLALEALDRLPAHAAPGMAKQTILKRWAAQDPAASLRWSLGHDPDLVGTVAAECIRNDSSLVESVLAVLLASDPSAPNRNANLILKPVSQMFKVLATRDREAAMNLLTRHELPPWEGRLHGVRPSLRAMASQDPAWILERAESLPAGDRTAVRAAAAQALADSDPVQAFEWARGQADSRELLKALLDQPKDVPAMIAGLATLSREEQAVIGPGFSLSWRNSDPRAVVEALESQAHHLSPEVLQGLLRGSISRLLEADDPGALANRLLALSDFSDHEPMTLFANYWAHQAPEAARTWAAALSDETQRNNALEAIEAATRPPEKPTALSLAEKSLQQVSAGEIAQPYTLMALDPADRRRVLDEGWARELAVKAATEQDEKNQPDESIDPFASEESVLPQISRHYPAETARWLSDTLTPESTSALLRTVTSTAAHWASEDAQAAAAWAQSLPPGDARAWAAVNVFDQWRQFDETGARVWWESLPAEERARISRENAPERP